MRRRMESTREKGSKRRGSKRRVGRKRGAGGGEQVSVHGHGPWIIVHGPLWTIVHAWISIKLSMHGSVNVH